VRRRPLLAVLVLLAVFTASAATEAGAREAHDCVGGSDVWFRAADGTRLAGHRFGGVRPGGRTAVVLAHQSNGSLCEWLPYARTLAAKGLFVFVFDFRGHGSSKGRPLYGRLDLDVAAAVKAVRSLGARKVVVVGASLGGIAGVVAAANISPAIDGIVAVSAPATIRGRLDALPSAPRLRVPVLFLAAGEDQNDPYDFAADAERLHGAVGTADKRLRLLPGSLHGVALVAGSAEARELVEAFIRDPRGSVRT
jgi:alpha-beta hydrolase superfamily lysophospholipase